MLDDLTTRDQRMLFAVVTLVHLADSKEQLDSDTETLQSIARKHLCTLGTLNYQQADGLITAMPLGLRRIDALRTLTTEALAVLMPYMQTYAPDYWKTLQEDDVAMKCLIDSDHQMASMAALWDAEPVTTHGLWIRNDWLEEQGLAKPSTLDDLENVMEVFKTKYGCTDAFALRDDCELPFSRVYDAFEWFLDEDGAVRYGYTEARDQFKALLSKANEWYEKEYYSSGFVTANDTTLPKTSMLVDGSTGLINADILVVSELSAMDDTIDLQAVAPITEHADEKLAPEWNCRISNPTVSVTTSCQSPEVAVAFMNYAFTEDCYMAANWGVEDVTYTLEDGEPVFTDLIMNNPNLVASFARLAYINPGFPSLKSYDLYLSTYTMPAQMACYEIFASKIDDTLPRAGYPENYVNFTTEESESIAQYNSDINTYVNECTVKFITGDMDVEKEYDGFADTLEEMGANEIKAVYQAAYDRFMGNS